MQRRNAAVFAIVFVFALTGTVLGQSAVSATVEKSERDTVIEALATKLSAGYVLQEAVGRITQALRSANSVGEYDGKTPQEFAEALGRTLRTAGPDKHFAVFYQPARRGSGTRQLLGFPAAVSGHGFCPVVDAGEFRCDCRRPAEKQWRQRPDDGVYRVVFL